VPLRNIAASFLRFPERIRDFLFGRPLAQRMSTDMPTQFSRDERGFTLIDILATIMVFGIIAAMTVPAMIASLDRLKLGQAAREVEREIHTAKSRAVSKGRVMRIRFNCPAAGQYRITELIGTASVPVAADNATNRCDPVAYPNTPPDTNPLTYPNLDGPVRYLPADIDFGATQTIEFWPDGTAHTGTGTTASPWPLIPVAGINVTVTRNSDTSTITVNGLGKIVLDTQ
jgi:prepilin-type N-terminal cleavage/methylation domain-containing protein